MNSVTLRLSTPSLLLAVVGLFATLPVRGAEQVQFNRDIRPILAETCFHCHGPDPGARKASLRLDTEAGFFTARDKDGPTVVKGQPDKSPMWQRIITDNQDDVMPPPDSHRELKPEQKELIKRWIAEGAPWQPHWSLIAPVKAALPEVKNTAWVRNPVDRFVLAKLEATGLQPAPEGGRRTLARRLSLDVTGLPPEPATVEAFVNDASPDAYEKFVDSLLKSERYGEHRARYWLDAARYADSHGMHFDRPREMWPYRDWVVRSFNLNEPFNQFTVEQIAGDLLPNPTEDQLIATGLQRCNMTTNEGGTIDEENLANYAADRVQTLGWVYFGLTTNCCQCHDHKFDPLTQRDYYSLAAFFRNTTQKPKDGNVKDGLGPILVLPMAADRERWKALPGEIAAAQAKMGEDRNRAQKEFDVWLVSAKPEDLDEDVPTKGLVAHVPLNEGAGSEVSATCGPAKTFKAVGEVTWKPDGKLGPAPQMKVNGTFDLGNVGDFEKNQAFSYGAWVRASRIGASGGIIARMDEKGGYRGWDLYQNDRSFSVHIINTWPDNALKVTTRKPSIRPGVWQHVFVTYDGSGKAGGVKMYIDGVDTELKAEANSLKGTIKTSTPTRIGQRSDVQVFHDGGVQDVRIYDRKLAPSEVMTIVKVGPLREMLASAKRSKKQKEALFEHYLVTRDVAFQADNVTFEKLTAEKTAISDRSPITHIQQEREGIMPMANVLMRGQYDKIGEAVEAAVPVALGKLPLDAPKNRLGLARWLVSDNNTLTARVIVNRMWQELFGTGLVKTSEDFGIMGSAPSHPELLDWLAVEFRQTGWDVKGFYRMLLTSASYRQAALTTPEKLEKDRDNSLLSRGPRFRMDAEMIRDYALAASGTLSAKMGGPGTKPYQPENVWEVVGVGIQNYVADKGENLYRRTLYNFWRRMAPPANMDIFNAPSREVCTVRRDRTNTPLQALVTMNDPQFVEAARNLAQAALKNSAGDEGKALDYVAHRVLCRPFQPAELAIVQASLKGLSAYYASKTDDAKALITVGDSKADEKLPAPALASWTMLCNQILNLDEVLNK